MCNKILSLVNTAATLYIYLFTFIYLFIYLL